MAKEQDIARTPWKTGDLVRYIGGAGLDFTARLTRCLDESPELGAEWQGRIKKIKRLGGNLSGGAKPGDEVTLFERAGNCTKIAHAKLDAEKRDALVQQLESDVITLLRHNENQAEAIASLKKTRNNLQQKVTEQAAELEKKIGAVSITVNGKAMAVCQGDAVTVPFPDAFDKLSEQLTWKARYNRLKQDYDREVQQGRQRVDFWQEKLLKAEADRDIFKKQAYAESMLAAKLHRELADLKGRIGDLQASEAELVSGPLRAKLSAVRKLVQDLEAKVEYDLSAFPAEFSERPPAASDRKGAYESAAASIGRGFATKKILDRLKAALAEGQQNVTVEYKFDEPKTRYWYREDNDYGHWAIYRETPSGQASAWYHTGNHWYDYKAPVSLFNEGAREISAADLPEGVTP